MRRVQATEADTVAQLGRQVFTSTYSAAMPPETLNRYLAKAFSTKTIATELADPKILILGAWQEAQLLGFSQLAANAEPSKLELARLYVSAEHQGLGLGRALLAESLREAATLRYTTLWLYVWEQNIRAIQFYRQQGFEQIGAADLNFEGVIFHDLMLSRRVTMP